MVFDEGLDFRDGRGNVDQSNTHFKLTQDDAILFLLYAINGF